MKNNLTSRRHSKTKIKAIIFDFDGTIVDFRKSDLLALYKVISLIPRKIDPEHFLKKSIDNIIEFHELVQKKAINPLSMHRYRLEKTFNDLTLNYDDLYLNTYVDELHNNPCLYPGIEDILQNLYNKIPLAILSNAYDSREQNIRIDKTNLSKYFDDIIIAADINTFKPDLHAFLYLVTKYQLEPDTILFIGDSEKYDIIGAKQAGMHSIKISHNKSSDNTAADFYCSDYPSLSKILDDHYEL